MNETSKQDWGLVLVGVGMIVLGFAFLIVPGVTLITVAAVAGVALLASGAVDAVTYARYRKELDLSGWMLAAAVLDMVLGAVIVLHPLASAVVVPWVAAIAFAVYGVLEIIAAWRLASAPVVPADSVGRASSRGASSAAYVEGSYAADGQLPDRKTPEGSWGWSFFGGVMAIVCAVAFFLAPESFAVFLAFFVMIRGVVSIAHGVSVGRAAAARKVA